MNQDPKKNHSIIRTIVIAVGAVFLIWFLIPLFTNVKPNIGNLTGIGVFAVVLLYGIFFDPVNQFLRRCWKTKTGKVIEILLAVIIGVIFSLAAVTYGCMLHAASASTEPNANVIVLGCKVNGEQPSLSLLYRMEAARSYLENNPDSLCIVTGSQGKDEVVTEASVMYRWFSDNGIGKDRLLAEEEALDTEENLLFSKALLEKRGAADSRVVVVTNDFHMYRALYIARSLGLNADGLAAKTPWWLYPTYVVREMYAILESWLLQ